MKYVNKFDTATQAIAATGLVAPQVVYVQDETTVLYSGNIEDGDNIRIKRIDGELVIKGPYKGLKFTSTGNSTIYIEDFGNCNFDYSLDNGDTWTQWEYTIPSGSSKHLFNTINLADGEVICVKGNNPNGVTKNFNGPSHIRMTGSLAASGDIMSLIDDGACTTRTIPSQGCFKSLFQNCTSLTSAPDLPATTLLKYCYMSMFEGCTSLTSAPDLPATIAHACCYYGMFKGCSSLLEAPEIMLDDLDSNNAFAACHEMFGNCTSLIKAPSILYYTGPDSGTGMENAFSSMFKGCTSLTTSPEIRLKHSYWNSGVDNSCISYMFQGCTNLNYIKCLLLDPSVNRSAYKWVEGVAATGTFVKAAGVTWPTGADGIPSGWTVQDAA